LILGSKLCKQSKNGGKVGVNRKGERLQARAADTGRFQTNSRHEHVEYLKENAEAVKVKISHDDDKRIRKTTEDVGGVKGARYPEAYLSWCFGDSPEVGNQ
jgi:hypothetical protein